MPLRKSSSKENPFMNTALLVDDVISSRIVEHSRLLSLGIEALAVNNVQEALEILMDGVRFDFIVVDFDLAIINGPEVTSIFFFFEKCCQYIIFNTLSSIYFCYWINFMWVMNFM